MTDTDESYLDPTSDVEPPETPEAEAEDWDLDERDAFMAEVESGERVVEKYRDVVILGWDE